MKEQRGLLHNLFAEVLEEFALVEAIREGRQTEKVGRDQIFEISRNLKKIPDRVMLNRIKQVIQGIEPSNIFQDVKGTKKMRAAGNYFRIRVGDHRIGVVIEEDEVEFVGCFHRRDIYRCFP